ncbi:MAG: SurA N-terminal domain-containing protein, partial [Pseudolabrys sp.]|nr:SurA N-terminal domain-containing protein [Pseudolabrys sp.]
MIAAASFAAPAHAQVVVLVNGAPITALDVEQRIKLEQITTNKVPTRQQAINLLIDDRLKLAIAKRYSFEIGDTDVDDAFGTMARRARMTSEQLGQMLTARGASAGAFKAKLRADITWQQ